MKLRMKWRLLQILRCGNKIKKNAMNRLITPNSEFEKVNKGCMTLGVPMLCIGFLVWGILKNHIDCCSLGLVLFGRYDTL